MNEYASALSRFVSRRGLTDCCWPLLPRVGLGGGFVGPLLAAFSSAATALGSFAYLRRPAGLAWLGSTLAFP